MKRRNLDMRPSAPRKNLVNRRFRNSEHLGDFPPSKAFLPFGLNDGNICLSQLGARILGAFAVCAIAIENMKRMLHILASGYHFQIHKAVIMSLTIFMVGFKIGWERAVKCFQDKAVYQVLFRFPTRAKNDKQIMVGIARGFKYAPGYGISISASNAFNTTTITSVINSFVTNNWFPSLFHRGILA